jgi:hypothetical protein
MKKFLKKTLDKCPGLWYYNTRKRKEKEIMKMWFVLENKTEKTVAMTAFKDAAEIIAASFPAECIVRYAAEIESGYSKDSKFFAEENSQEIKKGA